VKIQNEMLPKKTMNLNDKERLKKSSANVLKCFQLNTFAQQICGCHYTVYADQGFRLKFGKRSNIFISVSLLTTFETSFLYFEAARAIAKFAY